MYLIGFIALLLANAALYVALNVSNPGYLEPEKNRCLSCMSTDIEVPHCFLQC